MCNCNCQKVQKAIIVARTPITENFRLQLDEIMSATLHNAGTSIITINNHLTLKPNSTIQLAVPVGNFVFDTTLLVRFDLQKPGEINRLEIVETRLDSRPS